MIITVLCNDPFHPIIPYLRTWVKEMLQLGHTCSLIMDKSGLTQGDFLFLVSCSQIIKENERKSYSNTLVLHASDLPVGKGWSPHIWEIVNGGNIITVSLLEASNSVDSGLIWKKSKFFLEGHELLEEINEKLFKTELDLMNFAIQNYDTIIPSKQEGNQGSYLRKRTKDDSRLDPKKTIEEQFNILRVVDNQRYPAFFEYRGLKYVIKIEKS